MTAKKVRNPGELTGQVNVGRAREADLKTVRRGCFSDAEIAEIIAHVALDIFTNQFDIAAGVEVDFSKIAFGHSA